MAIELFERVGGSDRAAIAAEGERLLAFAAPDAPAHDIQVTPPREARR